MTLVIRDILLQWPAAVRCGDVTLSRVTCHLSRVTCHLSSVMSSRGDAAALSCDIIAHLDTSGQWTPQHGDRGESLGPPYFISIHSRKLPPVGTTDPTNQTHYELWTAFYPEGFAH